MHLLVMLGLEAKDEVMVSILDCNGCLCDGGKEQKLPVGKILLSCKALVVQTNP